jgi:hypothetical protein
MNPKERDERREKHAQALFRVCAKEGRKNAIKIFHFLAFRNLTTMDVCQGRISLPSVVVIRPSWNLLITSNFDCFD